MYRKRLFTLLTALVMLLAAPTALMETAPAETAYEVTLSTRYSPRLYTLAQFEDTSFTPAMAQPLLIGLASHLNKFTTTLLVSESGISGITGTEKAELMSFQAALDDDTGLTGFTTTLLPGIRMRTPSGMMTALKQQAGLQDVSVTAGEAVGALAKYADFVLNQFDGLLKDAAAEEGLYQDLHGGNYIARAEVTVTAYALADVIDAFADMLAEDALAQKLFPHVAQEFKAAMQNVRQRPNDDLLLIHAYQNAEGATLYDIRSNPEDRYEPFRAEVLVTQQENEPGRTALQADWVLTAPNLPITPVGEDTTNAHWAAAKEAIRSGENRDGLLLDGTVDTTTQDGVTALVGSIGTTIEGERGALRLSARHEEQVKLTDATLDFLYQLDEPLLTLQAQVKPTDATPAAPLQDGLMDVELADSISPEDQQLLTASFQKSWPQLMERLAAALY